MQSYRLHLVLIAFVSAQPLPHLSILFRPHHKHTTRCGPQTLRAWVGHDPNVYGGGGGYRTLVQNAYSACLNDISNVFIAHDYWIVNFS